MGLLSANLKTGLASPAAQWFLLLELGLPGGTKRYAMTSIASASLGQYLGKVSSYGSLGRSLERRSNDLSLGTVSVTIIDEDDTFSKILTGSSGNTVWGSTATIKFGEMSVAVADWLTYYSGQLDTYEQTAPKQWSLTLRRDDLPLRRTSVPKGIIMQSDWPNAPKSVINLRYPIVFGKHDSMNGTNQGAIPILPVESTKYIVGVGHLKSVLRVYVDGTPASVGSWSVSYPIVNGRLLTMLTFYASQGDAEITVDCEGLTTVYDGSGTLIEDPLAMLQYLLVQFVYNDWKNGAWLSTSTAPVDTSSLGGTFFSQRGVKGARYIATAATGLSEVNSLLNSFEMKGVWTPDGKIGVKILDPSAFAYGDTPFIRMEQMRSWSLGYPTDDIIDRITAQWMYIAADRTYAQSLEVRDVSVDLEASDDLSLVWSPSFTV